MRPLHVLNQFLLQRVVAPIGAERTALAPGLVRVRLGQLPARLLVRICEELSDLLALDLVVPRLVRVEPLEVEFVEENEVLSCTAESESVKAHAVLQLAQLGVADDVVSARS